MEKHPEKMVLGEDPSKFADFILTRIEEGALE